MSVMVGDPGIEPHWCFIEGDHAYNLNLRPSGYEHEYSLLLLFLESSIFRGNMSSIYSGLTAPTVTFGTPLGYFWYPLTVTFGTPLGYFWYPSKVTFVPLFS